MSPLKKIVLAGIAVTGISAVAYFAYNLLASRGEDDTRGKGRGGEQAAVGLARLPEIGTEVSLNTNTSHFASDKFGYSLDYPSALQVTVYDEGADGYTLLFAPQETIAGTATEKIGFQIFISPFPEKDALTRERILKDLPDAIIEDPQAAILGDGTKALIFWSNSAVGRTREVWFARHGWLFEISTYAEFDARLADILKTWRFTD